MLNAELPIDETILFIVNFKAIVNFKGAVTKLRDGKAAGICNISAELLQALGMAMIYVLHALLTAIWH